MKHLFLLTTLLLSSVIYAADEKEFNVMADNEIPAYASKANPNVDALIEDEDDIYLNDDQKIIPQTVHEENKELHYTIETTYPQIAGESLSKAAEHFNQRILNMVKTSTEDFKISVKKDFAHMQTLPEEVQKNHLKIDYDLDVINPEHETVISVRLSIEGMQAGRAHPFHAHQVLNYDLVRGKELELKDLFKTNAHFLDAIAAYSHQKLNAELKDQDKWMLASGTKPNTQNYKNWNMEEDALLITFDEYQVAPYTYGASEIEIPYSELNNILSTRSPIISSIKKAEQPMAG